MCSTKTVVLILVTTMGDVVIVQQGIHVHVMLDTMEGHAVEVNNITENNVFLCKFLHNL